MGRDNGQSRKRKIKYKLHLLVINFLTKYFLIRAIPRTRNIVWPPTFALHPTPRILCPFQSIPPGRWCPCGRRVSYSTWQARFEGVSIAFVFIYITWLLSDTSPSQIKSLTPGCNSFYLSLLSPCQSVRSMWDGLTLLTVSLPGFEGPWYMSPPWFFPFQSETIHGRYRCLRRPLGEVRNLLCTVNCGNSCESRKILN